MRSAIVFSAVSLLAQQAVAQADSIDALGHGSYVASRMRRKADINLNSGDYLKRHVEARVAEPEPDFVHRQAASAAATPTPSSSMMAAPPPMPTATGPVDLNPMMNDTNAACMQVMSMTSPPDDSGMAACFNINFFDNSTGFFQANMLLYKLAPPSGNWSSLQAGSVHLSMSFPGATAQTQPNTAMKKRGDNEEASSTTSADTAATPIHRTLSARSGAPVMMEAYTLLGNVVGSLQGSLTNTTAMRAALTPAISLTAMTAMNSMNMTASVAVPQGAAFVNGFFSDAFVAQQKAAATAAPPPFVLPGVTLGFFPIGLITISVWTALFLAVVGYGTLGRMQWRTAYRAKKPNASGK